jgi:hypothetical protein
VIVLAMLARPTGGEGVKSGPIGLAVILVLCIAAYFLFKSMSKHLKKVRDEFPTDEAGRPRVAPQPTDQPPTTPATTPADPAAPGDAAPGAADTER